jgi:ABC-type bacteriocin/lantibiotic exporter with double-glycine peptidase domain
MEILKEFGDQLLVIVSKAEQGQWQAKQAVANGRVLPVPHKAQVGATANARRNDCGAACVSMVLEAVGNPATVDAIAVKYQTAANRYMTFTELMMALRDHGVGNRYARPLPVADIAAEIARGNPVIALVKYPKMPRQFANFTGSHFVVVYGVRDGEFLYHDPLADGQQVLVISADELDRAMSEFDHMENLPKQGLIAFAGLQ